MNHSNNRKTQRIASDMVLRSVFLPRFTASVTDISEAGARIRFQGAVASNLVESRVRFGLSLDAQVQTQLEGFARVAWMREVAGTTEVGLEWEKLDWERAKGLLDLNVA